jgi:hypothetical protein
VMPLILFGRGLGSLGSSGLGIAFGGVYLGLVPMSVLQLLQYSDNATASDVFRHAPVAGPARLVQGALTAVLLFSAVPLALMLGVFAWLTTSDRHQLVLFLPGLIALPVYALIPCAGGRGLPLSIPSDATRGTRRGMVAGFSVLFALAIGGLATWAWRGGWFWSFVAVEAVLAVVAFAGLRRSMLQARWDSLE